MYLDHFDLKAKPFALSTDPRFLWAGANQRQALATLSYGLKENRGIVVLSGEFGVGKTTLINAFVQSLDDTVRLFQLHDPGADLAQFRLAVAEGFGIRIANPDKESLAEALHRRADDQKGYPQRFLLIVDEAQGLTAEMQADVLHLARLEHQGARRLHIVLVQQEEMYRWAESTTREALLNQVSATCRLHPLNERETAAYIDLRLRVAGAVRPLFAEEAVSAIHCLSCGVPRTINLICDFSLLHALMNGLDKVDAEMVGVCKDRFQIATRGDGPAPEVSERALTTVPTEPHTPHRPKFRRRLGLSMSVLLVLVAAGFWYDGPPSRTASTQDAAHYAPSRAVESSQPLRPAPSRPLTEPPVPKEASRKAAALPFTDRQPRAEQAAPQKAQRPSEERTPIPRTRTAASPPGDQKGARIPAVDGPGERPMRALSTLPLEAQRPPMDSTTAPQTAAPKTIGAEGAPKAPDRLPPKPPPKDELSGVAEPEPANRLPIQDISDRDLQQSVETVSATPEAPSGADPGDIIDWLIQEKQKGGPSQPPIPAAPPSSSE